MTREEVSRESVSDAVVEAARSRVQGTIEAFVEAQKPGVIPPNPFWQALQAAAKADIAAFRVALQGLDALAREKELRAMCAEAFEFERITTDDEGKVLAEERACFAREILAVLDRKETP
jgi:hypothetical protein